MGDDYESFYGTDREDVNGVDAVIRGPWGEVDANNDFNCGDYYGDNDNTDTFNPHATDASIDIKRVIQLEDERETMLFIWLSRLKVLISMLQITSALPSVLKIHLPPIVSHILKIFG